MRRSGLGREHLKPGKTFAGKPAPTRRGLNNSAQRIRRRQCGKEKARTGRAGFGLVFL